MKKIPLPFELVYATNTAAAWHVASFWMNAADVKNVRGAFELSLLESDVQVSLGYQTTNVENTGDTPTSIGSYATTAGVSYPSDWADISDYTHGKQLIRFGWMVKNASSSTKNWVRVGGFIQTSDT